MRKGPAIIIAAAMLTSAWFIYSKIAEHRREAGYNAAIAPFQRDLHLGMVRADVAQYLDSRGAEYNWALYGGSAESYLIYIGEEPGGLLCNRWKVYIALEFVPLDHNRNEHDPGELDPSDKLTDIHIEKSGSCL